jgi:chitosanase
MNYKIGFPLIAVSLVTYSGCSSYENQPVSGNNEIRTNYESEQYIAPKQVYTSVEKMISNTANDIAKNVILSLTCVAENDTTDFVFNYAENIHDGRGITFGIIGFTSGTFDGTILLKRIQTKNSTHPLCSYIPVFEKIDNLHSSGHVDNLTGLDNFITDFNRYGKDSVVKQAQLELLDELYWNPAMKIASAYGLSLNITKGQIYDASVRHGEDGAEEIAKWTTTALGGSPATGINEIDWLKRYFVERKRYYNEEDGETGIIERVDIMYQGILNSGNYAMVPPFNVKCYDETIHLITGGQSVSTGVKRRF